jgi:hypothetical protein
MQMGSLRIDFETGLLYADFPGLGHVRHFHLLHILSV